VYKWSAGGRLCIHSIDGDGIEETCTLRPEASASHKITLNITTAITDVYLPIEETTFHIVYASG
jgi:hypothetical protein